MMRSRVGIGALPGARSDIVSRTFGCARNGTYQMPSRCVGCAISDGAIQIASRVRVRDERHIDDAPEMLEQSVNRDDYRAPRALHRHIAVPERPTHERICALEAGGSPLVASTIGSAEPFTHHDWSRNGRC